MDYYLAIKKEWNLNIFDSMYEPRGYYAKWKKLGKDKYHMISLIVESKEQCKWANQTETDL